MSSKTKEKQIKELSEHIIGFQESVNNYLSLMNQLNNLREKKFSLFNRSESVLENKMHQTIEDVRKYLSNICHWMTTNKTLCFLRDDKNRPQTARSIEFSKHLDKSMMRSRTLFNKFSESIEDTEVCQQNLKISLEADKKERKKKERD